LAEDIQNRQETEGQPERKKVGCLMKGVCGTVGLLAVLVLALACWSHHLDGEAEKLLADARLLVDEIEIRQVPDEDNAAHIYIQTLAAVRAAGPRTFSRISGRLERCELEIGSKEVEALLKKNQPVLAQLAQAARKPHCVFPTDYQKGFHAPLPSLLAFREAVYLLALSARRAAHEGRFPEATSRIEQALHLSRGIGEMRMLICHMLAVAGEDIALTALRDILIQTEPDEASLRAALRHLDLHLKKRVPLRETFRVERALGMLTAAEIVAGESAHPASGEFSGRLKFQWHRITGGMFRGARIVNDSWDRVEAAAAKPYPRAYDELLAISNDPELTARLERLPSPYSYAAISWAATARSDANLLAVLRAARLAVGCQLYKKKFGAHPAKLADLTASLPKLFKSIPIDPFSGKPMLYKKTATGFVVYSVGGWDRADNGAPNPYYGGGCSDDPDVVFIVDPAKLKAYQVKQRLQNKRLKPRKPKAPVPPVVNPAAPSPGRTAP